MDKQTLFHRLPPGPNPPNKLYCLVEIPKGGSNKYEYDIEKGAFVLDRVLYEPVFYPTEYGLIPQTLSEDGDPLDAMVLSTHPTFPGCVITVRPIGVLRMLDTGEKDNKIIAVPLFDPRLNHFKDISELNGHFKKEVESFWKTYAHLEPNKEIEVLGWSGEKKAKKIIREAIDRYQKSLKSSKTSL